MENLKWKSPFEKLFGTPPNYQDLRVIGCLCFAANMGISDKFESKAKRCILLGYTFGLKGYKIYDLTTKMVFHSTDVVFSETFFPFKKDRTPTLELGQQVHFLPSCELFFYAASKSHIYKHKISNPSNPISPSTSNTDSALHIHEVLVPSPSIIPEPHPSMPLDSAPPSLSQSPNSLTSSTQSTPSTTSSCLQEPPHRKSQRAKRPPAWMKDFVCPQLTNKQTTIPPSVEPSTSHSFTITSYPLFSYANLAHFSPSYVASLTKILQSLKPISYAQAKLCLEWVKAMEIELAALEQNNTWQLTTLPPGNRALTSKWV